MHTKEETAGEKVAKLAQELVLVRTRLALNPDDQAALQRERELVQEMVRVPGSSRLVTCGYLH